MPEGIYISAFNTAQTSEMLMAPDSEFTILAINDSLLKTLSRRRDELVGKSIFHEYPSDPADPHNVEANPLHKSLLKVLATGKSDELPAQSYPIVVSMPDGSQRYEERFWTVSNTPVFDGDGNLVCISHRTTDVTEQKRASELAKFHTERESFQLVMADRIRPLTDPDVVIATVCELLGKQLDAGRVLYGEVDESGDFLDLGRDWTNGEMLSMAGKRLALLDFGAPNIDAVRAGRVVVVNDVTTDERSASFADVYLANGVRSFMAIPLMKQGRLRAILNVHDSNARHWTNLQISMADDLVDRTWSAVESARTQATLRLERDRTQSVFDTMVEGFGMIDRDWIVTYMNAEGLRLGGRPANQVLGRDHWEIWPEAIGSDMEHMYRRVMKTREPETVEYRHLTSEGAVIWLETRVFPSTDGGLGVFFRDVTARKESDEKLRDADRRKDEFLAMLAHELRNPLAPIGAAAQLLQMGKLNEERVQRTSAVIGRQVNHMTGLIDDLLDVSRVTRGLIELNKVALDIYHVVNEAVEQVNPLIRTRGHELVIRHAPQVGMICGDKKRLVQVLANVLNNAAKYTAKGGHLVLSALVRESDVLIEVTDDGIGMTADMTRHAFDLFAQAERTSDRSSGGLGLGLALVKSLVDLHDGTVSCKSGGLGQGTTFSISLPLLRQGADLGSGRPEETAPLETAAASLRILVVDDNVDAAAMLKMLLETLGHEVRVEHGAYRALEWAKLDRPQVCLLDIGLPEMDGNELARQLRAQPENRGVMLIAVTGYGQESDRTNALSSGFDYHLVKPVDTTKLLSILSAVKVS